MKKKMKWYPIIISGRNMQKFAEWLNCWGNDEKHSESTNGNKITNYGKGYQQAISDVYDYLKLKYRKE